MEKTHKRTYMSTTPSRHITTIESLKLTNVLVGLGRGLFSLLRYLAFTAVCGLAFYFLLRSI